MPEPGDMKGVATRFAMSVDVEDYFQVWAFSSVVDKASWCEFRPRVDYATRLTLDALDARGANATFFILGWVAERFPDLVREIAQRGHEIASHGWDHEKVFSQTKAEFIDDVSRTRGLLEDIAGVRVMGYRAPGFSINANTPWAYEVLVEAGYRYSSSSHPIAHDHYGDPQAPRRPHRPVAGDEFLEAPVATAEVAGRRVSCAGGGWFRSAPYLISKWLIDRAGTDLGGPFIFYFHPWEIDVGQPRIANAPLKSKFRHYLNLRTMAHKLDRLMTDFRWTRIDDALGLADDRAAA